MAVDRPGPRDKRPTDWFNIEVWARPAEIVGEYLKKGRQVAISGRLSVRKWTDNAGNEREYLSIVANDVQLLGSRREVEQNSGGGYQGGQQGGSYNNPSNAAVTPF